MEKKQVMVLASSGCRGLETLDSIRDEVHVHLLDSVGEAQPVIGQVEIVFAWDSALNGLLEGLWPQAESLQWVQSGSAGVESLLFPEFAESSVVLTSGRGLYSDVLAEFVAGAIIYFAQNLDRQAASQRARIWARAPIREVRGQTLGIVGVGDVGCAAAKLARCLNMRLLGCKRNLDAALQDLPIDRLYPPERLLEMLPECDYVVLTLPLTSQTRGIIGRPELEAMKSSSVLINIARGALVQEQVLIQALQEGWIRGAALDVFEREPLPEESPLWGMDNMLLSPHCADYTTDVEARQGRLFVKNLRRYLKGAPLLNIVEKMAGY